MIKEQDGRAHSITTLDELEADLLKDLSNMNPEELKALKIILEEAQKNKESKLLNAVYNAEYIRQPVDMKTFILDEQYLGKTCYAAYPAIIKDLEELFSGNYHEVVLTGSTRWGKCAAGDTEYYNPVLGTRCRVDQSGSTSVISYNTATGKQCISAAIAEPSGVKPCIHLTLRDGSSIEVSVDHPIFTNKGWIKAENITINSWIATPRFSPSPLQHYEISDEELKLIAYLMSDGGTSCNNTSFTNGCQAILQEVNDICVTIGHASKAGLRPLKKQKSANVIQAYLKGISKYVSKHNLRGCLAKSKRLPSYFYGLSDRHIGLFLNRFIACDGHIEFVSGGVPRVEIGLASEKLIDDLKFLLSRLGVLCSKKYKKASYVNSEGVRLTFDCWRLRITGYDNIPLLFRHTGLILGKEEASQKALNYYQAKIFKKKFINSRDVVPIGNKEIVEILRETNCNKRYFIKKYWTGGSTIGRNKFKALVAETGYKGKYQWLADTDLFWSPVVKIEYSGEKEVYDLCVPHNQNYVANNILIHNTFSASIGICRILYELSCMRDPYKSLGLAAGSGIYIVGFSVREALARKVVYANIATKISSSPYFKEHFSFEETKAEMRFPNGIEVWARSSTDQSALGLNVISALIDEANFMDKALDSDDLDKVETLYNLMERRIRNTFEKAGRMPGKLFMISSKNTIDDFVNRKVRDCKEDPTIFVRDRALWEVVPEKYEGSARFHVLCGNETIPSKLVDDPEEVTKLQTNKPDNTVLVEVPHEFRKQFERDLEGSIKDVAGIAIVSNAPYINRREKIEEAVDPNRSHPFTTESHDPTKPGKFLWEQMVHWVRERQIDGTFKEVRRPKVNPQFNRHVHFDPAFVDDKFGICMGHVAGWTEVERISPEGKIYLEKAPVYYIDFLLRIVPPVGGEIVIGEARQLVYDLSHHGYPISKISIDGAESRDSLQIMSQKGYATEYVSVDLKPDPYDTLKMALYENRVKYYRYEPLLKELRGLILEVKGNKRKIEHPKTNSKDIADALAGCVYTLSKSALNVALPIYKSLTTNAQEAWMPEQRSAMPTNPTAIDNKRIEDVEVMPMYIGSEDPYGGYGGNGEGGFGGGGWSDW